MCIFLSLCLSLSLKNATRVSKVEATLQWFVRAPLCGSLQAIRCGHRHARWKCWQQPEARPTACQGGRWRRMSRFACLDRVLTSVGPGTSLPCRTFLYSRTNSFFFIVLTKIEFDLVSLSEHYDGPVFVPRNTE